MKHGASAFCRFDSEEAAIRFLQDHIIPLCIPNGGPVYSYSLEDEGKYRDLVDDLIEVLKCVNDCGLNKGSSLYEQVGNMVDAAINKAEAA